MQYGEETLSFMCGQAQLLGILTRPQQPTQLGVVIVVGGPQYRVGSHRQHVRLARALAQAGHAVLRFDFCGMGDSQGLAHGFAASQADIEAAISALLGAVAEVQEVALWGLCDGASAALLYLHATHDTRVTKLCLANPWVRSQDSLQRVQLRHYYGQRLLQPDFWHKLLHGQLGPSALRELWHKAGQLLRRGKPDHCGDSYQLHMALACLAFEGHTLLLLSDNDLIAKEFLQHAAVHRIWQKALHNPKLHCQHVPQADHTFSASSVHALVVALTLRHLAFPAKRTPQTQPARLSGQVATPPAPLT